VGVTSRPWTVGEGGFEDGILWCEESGSVACEDVSGRQGWPTERNFFIRRSCMQDPHLHSFSTAPTAVAEAGPKLAERLSAEGRPLPRPRRAHKPNIGAYLNNALHHHDSSTCSQIHPTHQTTASKALVAHNPQPWLVNSSSAVTLRCMLRLGQRVPREQRGRTDKSVGMVLPSPSRISSTT
jgi:hypothetical protein